jgi:predicted DCC family thiol-disulfide oxidoreductase YuxK
MTTLIFDGYCGFCTRAIRALERLDRNKHLRFQAWQTPGTLEAFELDQVDVQQAAWLVTTDGRRYHGAKAIVGALAVAIQMPWLVRIFDLPPMAWAANSVYTWVARNRYRLRGVQAYCLQQGSNCADGVGSCRLPSKLI